jgi:hypothetical protein
LEFFESYVPFSRTFAPIACCSEKKSATGIIHIENYIVGDVMTRHWPVEFFEKSKNINIFIYYRF